MPLGSVVCVLGSWLILFVLTSLYYFFWYSKPRE